MTSKCAASSTRFLDHNPNPPAEAMDHHQHALPPGIRALVLTPDNDGVDLGLAVRQPNHALLHMHTSAAHPLQN